jgi:hypothetical protein
MVITANYERAEDVLGIALIPRYKVVYYNEYYYTNMLSLKAGLKWILSGKSDKARVMKRGKLIEVHYGEPIYEWNLVGYFGLTKDGKLKNFGKTE